MSQKFISSFRFFPDEGIVRMRYASQVGVEAAVVPADAPPGGIWPLEQCLRRRDEIEAAGLRPLVIESISTTDELKIGGRDAARDTDAFIKTMEHVAEAGFQVVVFNWMLVVDWVRTHTRLLLPDGSTTLAYRHSDWFQSDSSVPSPLPGWSEQLTADELSEKLARYRGTSESQLWDALAAFVERVAPVAAALNLKLALHPCDPPWAVGVPRIITGEAALQRFLDLSDQSHVGLCFCTGALGASPANAGSLPDMIRRFQGRIHFAHLRDVWIVGPQEFIEVAHGSGCLPLPQVMSTLIETGFSGPIRPDHGRNILGENVPRPGYGMYDRAMGLRYLQGLHAGLCAAADRSRNEPTKPYQEGANQ